MCNFMLPLAATTHSPMLNAELCQKRRARVRKAQQAFQKRKEAAVQSLEERLNNVQNGLEEFSTAFSNFTTTVAESGIANAHPHVLHQIHDLTERLLHLARIASPQSPTSGDEAARQGASSRQEAPVLTRTSSGTSVIRPTTSSPGTPGFGADHLFPSDLSYFENMGEDPEGNSGGDQMNIWRVETDVMPHSNTWMTPDMLESTWKCGNSLFLRRDSLESQLVSPRFSCSQDRL